MTWEMFTGMMTIFGAFSGLMIWMMTRMENRIHADFNDIKDDLKSARAESDAKWLAVNARVDQTQAIIMRMLEKQGR